MAPFVRLRSLRFFVVNSVTSVPSTGSLYFRILQPRAVCLIENLAHEFWR